jgi:hypothetical protein
VGWSKVELQLKGNALTILLKHAHQNNILACFA